MSANPAKAKPGQKAIDTTTWNAIVDMLDWWKRTHALGSPGAPTNQPRQTDLIHVSNETGGDLAKYSVLAVGDYSLTTFDRMRLIYEADDIANVTEPICSLQWTCKAGAIVEAQVSGVGPVLVNVGATWHRRAYPTRGANVLTSGIFGPFELLGTPTETGEQTCVCRMGCSGNRGVIAKTTTAITAASLASGELDYGSGTVQIYDPSTTATQFSLTTGSTTTAYNMAGDTIASGTFVTLFPGPDWLPLILIEPCTAPA